MSDKELLTTNENPHAKWLREVSKQIADAGHYGWGNTAEWAADEIDRLTAEVAELRRERDMWSQLWDNVKLDNPTLREDNKPLAVAACYALLKLEADRMREALVMSVNAMREPFDGWKGEVEALALAAARAALGEQP